MPCFDVSPTYLYSSAGAWTCPQGLNLCISVFRGCITRGGPGSSLFYAVTERFQKPVCIQLPFYQIVVRSKLESGIDGVTGAIRG